MQTATAPNIVPLPAAKPQKAPAKNLQRFKIQGYINPRTGSKSWRVSGCKRDGTRVRENFGEQEGARVRQVELETEYLKGHADTTIRATKLSAEQLQLAEVAFIKLGDDWQRILDAVDYWKNHGKRNTVVESPRIDDAVAKFKAWLDDEPSEDGNGVCTLRQDSRPSLKNRVNVFANSIGNLRVNEISIDTIENFLGKLKVSPITRDNYRRDVSRFFSWTIERPRRWATVNPCKEIKIAKPEKTPPQVLSVEQCKNLLQKAEPSGLATYVAVCLFGGLRPFEVSRLDWKAVNLQDKEIRLEGTHTKTGRPRVVAICPTLARWLRAYEGQSFFPSGWHKRFRAVKKQAGLTKWVVDVMRHTAISHYFRKTGSYGQTAEQFGNSEAIIKAHYQSRVSSADMEKFYALKPATKKASK